MMLYLPIACPGSGKSYLANKMVEAGMITADAVVSPDRYREIMCGNRATQEINKEVFNVVDQIVDQRIRYGLDVYLDATNLNAKLLDRMLKRVNATYRFYHALGGKVPTTLLLSEAPRSLVEARNRDRAHPVPDHVFESFWRRSEAFDPQPYVASQGAAVQTFEAVLASIEEAQSGQINHTFQVSEKDWDWIMEES